MRIGDFNVSPPDYEVRVSDSAGQEIFVAGLFFTSNERMDVGLGIAETIDPETVGSILSAIAIATHRAANWFEIAEMGNAQNGAKEDGESHQTNDG